MKYLLLSSITRAISASAVHYRLTNFSLTSQNFTAITLGVRTIIVSTKYNWLDLTKCPYVNLFKNSCVHYMNKIIKCEFPICKFTNTESENSFTAMTTDSSNTMSKTQQGPAPPSTFLRRPARPTTDHHNPTRSTKSQHVPVRPGQAHQGPARPTTAQNGSARPTPPSMTTHGPGPPSTGQQR
jgi:hypothetical protein